MNHQIILGFDFGLKRIGVATGQIITCTATPLTTLAAEHGEPSWEQISKLIKEWGASILLVGLPFHLNGSPQKIMLAAEAFAKQLQERFQLPTYMHDERFSTKEARADIFERGGYKQLKKTKIDAVAAQKILESWMRTHEPF